MKDEKDALIRLFYKKWKQAEKTDSQVHPDEELLSCFQEDKLPKKYAEELKKHIIGCERCAEILATGLSLKTEEEKPVPGQLIAQAKNLVKQANEADILEISIGLKEKILELIDTCGDVLLGQELVPGAVLRSRNIKDFKDEVTVFKDFKDIRIEARIESPNGENFSLSIIVKEKKTQELLKGLRITLLMDDLELESYLSDSGRVSFEHIMPGKYRIDISRAGVKLAVIKLEILK